MIFRNIKISYKLVILFVIFAFILAAIGSLGYASTKDLQVNFKEVQDYAVPSLTTSNKLQNRVQVAIIAAYDYLISGDPANKDKYNDNLAQAFEFQVQLFETTKDQADVSFIEKLNSDLYEIKVFADRAIEIYDEDPEAPEKFEIFSRSIELRDQVMLLLKNNVENRILDRTNAINEQFDHATTEIIRNLLIAAGVALLIFVLLIFVIIKSISKPINKLSFAATEIGKGNLVEVKLKNNDELGLLGKTLNKMGKDILTAKDALEIELEKTKKFDQQKTEFISVAAHQLRTPSSGVKWVLDMTINGDFGSLTKDQKHYLTRGLENVTRMTKVIDDLLNVTKIEEQRFAYNFKKNDINKLTKDALDNFEGELKKKKLTLKTNFGKITAFPFDYEKMHMAISNLIDNSIKYTAKGNIEITTSQKKGKVLFTISDTGAGIPKKLQSQVFTKFFRGTNILQVHQDGSGLGLYVVQDVVSKHNGRVWFESKENKGTNFFIELPKKQDVKKIDGSNKIEKLMKEYNKAPSDYLDKKLEKKVK